MTNTGALPLEKILWPECSTLRLMEYDIRENPGPLLPKLSRELVIEYTYPAGPRNIARATPGYVSAHFSEAQYRLFFKAVNCESDFEKLVKDVVKISEAYHELDFDLDQMCSRAKIRSMAKK